MSAYFYDEALKNKFQSWSQGTEATLLGPEETRRLLEVISDKNNDAPVKLPILCIRRIGGYTVQSKGKRPLTYDGKMLKSTIPTSISLNAIPIELKYRFDVITRYYKEADEYMRNAIFNIINFPRLSIEIPYENVDIEHDSNIRITSEVEDNSNIAERLNAGQFTVLSIAFTIDDAYLFDVRVRDNYSIDFDIQASITPP